MSFFYKYKACRLEDGSIVHRPLIPFCLSWHSNTINTFGILDSGSDTTIIPLEMARFLNLDLEKNNKIFGLDRNFVRVKEAKVNLTIGNDRENYTLPIAVHVPIENVPINIVVGRQGIFDNFEITFNQLLKKIRFKKMGNLK